MHQFFMSQSLSIRAMSFDVKMRTVLTLLCLNPFRSGQCLSTREVQVFENQLRLNPFRSGQCLSTCSRGIGLLRY